jgi:hypothetical protein
VDAASAWAPPSDEYGYGGTRRSLGNGGTEGTTGSDAVGNGGTEGTGGSAGYAAGEGTGGVDGTAGTEGAGSNDPTPPTIADAADAANADTGCTAAPSESAITNIVGCAEAECVTVSWATNFPPESTVATTSTSTVSTRVAACAWRR